MSDDRTFRQRFNKLIQEAGSRRALATLAKIPDSTLQRYAEGSAEPGRDSLVKLAAAANVNLAWLAAGEGEMRPPGGITGPMLGEIALIELRDPRAWMSMEQILAFLPFNRFWLRDRLGINDPKILVAFEAPQAVPPIEAGDLMLVDRRGGENLTDGFYLLQVETGIAVRRVQLQLDGQVLISGPSSTEMVAGEQFRRHLIGRIIWRGQKL